MKALSQQLVHPPTNSRPIRILLSRLHKRRNEGLNQRTKNQSKEIPYLNKLTNILPFGDQNLESVLI